MKCCLHGSCIHIHSYRVFHIDTCYISYTQLATGYILFTCILGGVDSAYIIVLAMSSGCRAYRGILTSTQICYSLYTHTYSIVIQPICAMFKGIILVILIKSLCLFFISSIVNIVIQFHVTLLIKLISCILLMVHLK